MLWLIGALACAILSFSAQMSGAQAAVHALVVGIDDYAHEKKLAGAVADADDIASALQRLGIKPVVLKDGEVSRARLLQAWEALVARAAPGDTLMFTYAGHGGSEPWKSTTSQTETAESFLLQKFRAPRPSIDAGERVLGKEIKSWFKAAAARHGGKLRIIFVADSCHAGGLMRTASPGADVTYRSTGIPYDVSDAPIVVPRQDEATDAELAHVTFIAATQADKRIPEIVVDGKKRGALSYAFARALEGQGGRDGRNDLTNESLRSYLTTTVRSLSEAQQTPEIRYRAGGGAETVLAGLPAVPLKDLSAGQTVIRLKLDGASVAAVGTLKSTLTGTEIVTGAAPADLIWRATVVRVLNALGDVVAETVDVGKLQGVVDKWRALAAIKAMVAARPLGMSISPDDSRHKRDCRVTFRSEMMGAGYVTAFNLASDGSTQFLFPRADKKDPTQGKWRAGEPYELPLKVTGPYGADHLVVISSATPLQGLQRQLQAEPPVHRIAKLLADALATSHHSIGLQGLYSEDQPCGGR